MNFPAWISVLVAAAHLASAEVTVVTPQAGLQEPLSVVFGGDGTIFGVESGKGNRLFAIGPDGGSFTVIAGNAGPAGKELGDIAAGDGGPAGGARFNGMGDLAMAPDGRIYIADTFNNRIRVIDRRTGVVDTFAGTGGKGGFGGDGRPAREAAFNGPYSVTMSPDGARLLVTDLGNRRVREIDMKTTIVRTVAGNGRRGVPRDGGTAIREPLVSPQAACYGADGRTIYIASRDGHALREISPEGRITTVVNREGIKGYGGDGRPATEARMNGPSHLSRDPDGNIVIADALNHCIRAYHVRSRMMVLLAGLAETAGSSLGAGRLDTLLRDPRGTRFDAEGNLHVMDSGNNRILKFTGN